MTYDEAVSVLKKSGHSFSVPVCLRCWSSNVRCFTSCCSCCAQVDGDAGLVSEHERYLAETHCKSPVFVTDYPASMKPFYMLRNDDDRTVACTDLLVPRIVSATATASRRHMS
jgi:asparaginyl-tRNA synthetase